ncbi:MAG TPA: response regulator transcription factor [Acidimicrobiales bacterium]|nr:response regulator transcription factor [Acidimicrobiales bacterium]
MLVVEDDESYRDALSVALDQEGFAVTAVSTFKDGLHSFVADPPDIVLLDVLLPDGSGLELCRQMSELAPIPVMLTSALSDEVEVVLGLELGASDYVTKPYRLGELVARMRAVLRRRARPHDALRLHRSEDVVVVGPMEIDLVARQLYLRGDPVHLSRREFDLLVTLASPPGVVRTRQDLIDRVWADADLSDTKTLDKHIRSLRAKIEIDPSNPACLVTVHRVGFRLDCERGCTPGVVTA